MVDPERYDMSYRPVITFPVASAARALVESIPVREARDVCLKALEEGHCVDWLLYKHLPPSGAKYVWQFSEGVKIVTVRLGTGIASCRPLSILVRQRAPGALEYRCGSRIERRFQEVATGNDVATLEEMIEILKRAYERTGGFYGWPGVFLSFIPNGERVEPEHSCIVESPYYRDLEKWSDELTRRTCDAAQASSPRPAEKP